MNDKKNKRFAKYGKNAGKIALIYYIIKGIATTALIWIPIYFATKGE